MNTTGNEHYLLTPGPLTTSLSTKHAMLRDWGSRDHDFIELIARVRENLVRLVGGQHTHECVPVQGSGTFAIEAALGTLVPADGKVLVLVNGAYGKRMVRILRLLRRDFAVIETPEDTPSDVAALQQTLTQDEHITDVAMVYCETTSGLLNPLDEVATAVAKHRRRLLVDAMSAFGALPLDVGRTPIDAIMASSNKCLEGVPGIGFVIARRATLQQCEGRAHSLSLDLYDQWRGFERNGQWRFTPPTHVMAALGQALAEFEFEGGVEGRGGRYRQNCRLLIDGMREMGFETLLADDLQAPIIVTFKMPAHPRFDFERFYAALRERSYVIYPGKLTVAPSFRIGCIGQIHAAQIRGVLTAVRETLTELKVTDGSP